MMKSNPIRKRIILNITIIILLINVANALDTNGTVHYYMLDNLTYYDSTNNQNGANGTAPTIVASGVFDNEASFVAASTQRILVDPVNVTDYPFTMCAWVNSSDGSIFGFADDTAADKYIAIDIHDGSTVCRLRGDDTTHQDNTVSSRNCTLGRVFVCMVGKGDSDREMFINGTSEVNSTVHIDFPTSNVVFGIATTPRSGSDPFGTTNGQIDEVSVWNIALDSNNISDLYNSGNGYQYPFAIPPSGKFQITAINKWNNGAILTFNVTYNGTTESTTNGTIITSIDNNDTILYNLSIQAENYFTNNTNNYNISNDLQLEMFQSEITPICLDEQGNTITCTNQTIYPPVGTIEIQISATGYYNVSQNKTITALDNKTINFTGFYSKRIGLTDDVTGSLITGLTCSVDGTSYIQDSEGYISISVPSYTTKNLSCYKSLIYSTHVWTLNNTVDTINLSMEEYKIKLYFQGTTTGNITDTEKVTNFTNTSVILKQSSFPIGKVIIRWNESSNYTQVMEYYNTQESTITANLAVITQPFDNTRTVKVTGQGVTIENARVTAEEWNGTDYLIVYGKITDVNGEALLYLQEDKDYRITIQATNYEAKTTTLSTSTSDTSTLTIDLDPTSGETENSHTTNCGSKVNSNTTCYFQAVCNEACSSVSITTVKYFLAGTNTTTTSSISTTTGATFSTTINTLMSRIEVNISVNNIVDKNYNISMDAIGNMTQPFDSNLINKNTNSAKIWVIIILIAGIIIGGLTEKKVKKEAGMYAIGAWFLIWGTIIPIFYVLAGIIAFLKISMVLTKNIMASD